MKKLPESVGANRIVIARLDDAGAPVILEVSKSNSGASLAIKGVKRPDVTRPALEAAMARGLIDVFGADSRPDMDLSYIDVRAMRAKYGFGVDIDGDSISAVYTHPRVIVMSIDVIKSRLATRVKKHYMDSI